MVDDISANFIRANDYMTRVVKLYFLVPRINLQVASLIHINGEIWICDSGLNDGGEMLLEYLLRLRSNVVPAEYANDENCKLCVNAYISHFHSDHVRGLMNHIMQSPYIVVEDVYTSKPETDPAMRPATGNYDKWLEISGEYAEKHGTRICELEWGEHVHIDIGHSGATIDLYAAITDWSIKYENADGTHGLHARLLAYEQDRGVEFAHLFAQNLNSTWAVVNYGKNRLFFTADYSGFGNSTLTPTMDDHGRENFTHVDILMYPNHGCARYSKMLVDVSTRHIPCLPHPSGRYASIPNSLWPRRTAKRREASSTARITVSLRPCLMAAAFPLTARLTNGRTLPSFVPTLCPQNERYRAKNNIKASKSLVSFNRQRDFCTFY